MNRFIQLIEKVGIDRVTHLLVGFGITSLGFPMGNTATLVAFAVSVFVALAKELYDQFTYGGFDAIDMLWTDAGAAAAVIYFLIISAA